ncbi:TPA: helix-turn-helix domain-containing protein, partial [Klebsiella pneumoniae]|nr:helix-turn-helix domain-containing protein [Klebsiella pneumoniae]
MYRATKVRIYPTQEQTELLDKQFGAVRFAYNKALHIRSHWYKKHGVSLNNAKHIQPLLPIAKKSRRYSWI